MDYQESLFVKRINDSLYCTGWVKIDLTNNVAVEWDWESRCNSTILNEFLYAHHYDAVEVGIALGNPNNTLYTKTVEY